MRYLALTSLLLIATPLLAQDMAQEDADKGYLTTLIEDALSGSGREVLITGFQGALSSKATIDRLTIADREGIWFEASGVTLDWNRAALLRGALSVNAFTAADLTVFRTPLSDPSAPSPEATPFSLPNLPVSIELGTFAIGRVTLGAPLLGETIALALDGTASLADGEGAATLRARRTDGALGSLSFTGNYANETRMLDLDLSLNEGKAGIVSRVLDLPDQPSLALALKGQGPLTDFGATLDLSTDGAPRLAGAFRIGAQPAEIEGTFDRTYSLDLGGDVTALFLPEFRDFFGADVVLTASGTQFATGRLRLDALDLKAQSVELNGTAALDENGWPEHFNLEGQIASPSGARVRLPLAGAATVLNKADLAIDFDAEAGDAWTATFTATDFERPGLSIPALQLSGGGVIDQGDNETLGQVTAALDYAAMGIALDDLGLSDALGDQIAGHFNLAYTQGAPIKINELTLEGAGLDLAGTAEIDPTESVIITADLSLAAQALERFSTLVGRPIGGSAALDLSGSVRPLSGAFDLMASGETQDLALGLAELDGLIAGQGSLELRALRDETGTHLPKLLVRSEGATLNATATLTSTESDASLLIDLKDLALLRAGLAGPATLTANARQSAGGQTRLIADLTHLNDTIKLAATSADFSRESSFDTTLSAQINELADYAAAFGQTLSGGLSADIEGEIAADFSVLDLGLKAQGTNISVGIDPVDTLTRGASTLAARISRESGGTLHITNADFTAPNVTANTELSLGQNTSEARFSARFPDIAVLTPDISGSASLDGTATQAADGAWLVDVDAIGPGGTKANVNGRIGTTGRLDLAAKGVAALGLANSFIEPRRIEGIADFNLRLSGPANLSSLSGSIATREARLSAPTFGQSLENIAVDARIGGNQVRLDLNANVDSGGAIEGRGSIGFGAGLPASLSIDLLDVALRDPELYQTTLRGSLGVEGPLAGGAQISGTIDLGGAELRVPSSSVGALGDLPTVAHLDAPASVQTTLSRAGLTLSGVEIGSSKKGGSARPYGLDITVNAPSQIFIRGRGLDAEVGGRVAIKGTTDNIIPVGQFDLVRGRLNILQQRFDLDEGAVSLEGGFVPFIRLVAGTEARTGTAIQIIVEGPADAPQVNFSSVPEMPQDEILAQLIFGRDLASITPFQAVQLATAVGTLAGKGGDGLVDKLRAGIGLDDIDVTSDDNGNTAVRAGKYISDNIYTDVTISSDGASAIDLNLDLSDTLTARGSATTDGETSIGIFFERDY